MLVKVIFVIVTALCGGLAFKVPAHKNKTVTDTRFVGSYPAPLVVVPYVALIVKTVNSQSSNVGAGATLSNQWIICYSGAVAGAVSSELTIYTGVKNALDLSASVPYPVKQIILHENIDEIVNALALLKVCPMSVGSSIALPAAPREYSDSDPGYAFSFNLANGRFEYIFKLMGIALQCSSDPKFDAAFMSCYGPDATSHFVTGEDMNGPVATSVTTNWMLLGILVKPLSTNAEIIINVSKYLTWINSKTGL